MMTLGYSGQVGGDGNGVLHRMLEGMGLDDVWGYTFILIGFCMFQGAIIEFVWGRHWKDPAISRAALYRKFCALGAAFIWLIVFYLQITTPLRTFVSMFLLVPLHVGMASYIFFETARVRYYTRTVFDAARAH